MSKKLVVSTGFSDWCQEPVVEISVNKDFSLLIPLVSTFVVDLRTLLFLQVMSLDCIHASTEVNAYGLNGLRQCWEQPFCGMK